MRILRLTAVALLLACAFHVSAAELYHEPFRPQFHFTPERNWMNDPNGMVFFKGEYHLFYQYNPFGDKWGHMSWGHAVSRDLVHWEHLPVALPEENGVMIFSGSAVVDWKNTSGFGQDGAPPLVAIYTGHYTKRPLQNQHIAYSTDRGRTWTKFSGNPVLDIGEKDFRDPKVFWHEPTRRWVMAVAWPVKRNVRFYASPNLKQWTHLSDFGPTGSTNGIWECPDLFPVRLEGKPGESKWVLIVNVGSGAPAGGSGCQYFVGDFDGTRFTLDEASQLPLWADYGRDFYAAVSWSDIPKHDGRRLWIGWMSNWEYAGVVPTSPWRSAMSLPRELLLRRVDEGFRLLQTPVRELRKLRSQHVRNRGGTVDEIAQWLRQKNVRGAQLEIDVDFEVRGAAAFGLKVRQGNGEETVIRCEPASQRLFLDRARSGKTDFHAKFSGVYEAPLLVRDGRVRLQVFVDTSSVEVFANDGEAVLTGLVLPVSSSSGLEVWGTETGPKVRRFDIWKLRSVWREYGSGGRSGMATTSLPFIFLTAKGEKLDVRAGMSLGADDYCLVRGMDDKARSAELHSAVSQNCILRGVSQSEHAGTCRRPADWKSALRFSGRSVVNPTVCTVSHQAGGER
ncbi:MAG: levanase [Verrucomicrobia bacterium]|nr:levanase [Verrucomicrobiota bacterium]